MNENKNAHKDIATTPRPQMAASGRLDFISFRIAQKSYTIYKMSPRTTARIMAARHIGKGSDGSKACIVTIWQTRLFKPYMESSQFTWLCRDL